MLQITPIELTVLQLLADGMSAVQIAALLDIDEYELDDLLVALFSKRQAPRCRRCLEE